MKFRGKLRKILSLCGLFCAAVAAVPVFSATQQARTLAVAAAPRASISAQNAPISAPRETAKSNVAARSATAPVQAARSTVSRPASSSDKSVAARIASIVPKPVSNVVARAAMLTPPDASMSEGYNSCRDAYFTCMDQFCANKDDTYRRCACSSRLDGLREMERKVNQTKESLQNFADYNIDAVSKTAKEVAASLTATAGESAALKDKSESAQKLAGISAVLGGAKSKALSTAGRLDIAGDISAIWSTPDFIGGADIMNLEGEALYSQVHGQCIDMIASVCPREATLRMVVSAYGMYIEQDCNVIQAAIEGKKTAAAATVRATGRELDLARLQNYNAHNSTAINECIAQVRKDVTSENACGKDYVHCLDVTGLFLDYNTGVPIYSSDFFKLEKQTSLDGDFLNSTSNRLLTSMLEDKKKFAERGLDTCRDLADDVWREFKRQAIVEIYQAQQARVKQVRDECLSTVNQCYDEKIGQLKNFGNIDEQMIIGQSVGTAEALCQEKMHACSNVFGGGPTGLSQLLTFVREVGSSKISENCQENLDRYIREVCAVANDLNHTYPYSCRVRNPGSYDCAAVLLNPNSSMEDITRCSHQSGSVFELLVKYARENCVRPDFPTLDPLPTSVMGSVNKVFDAVFFEMRMQLKAECERYSGEWVDSGYKSTKKFYINFVGASDGWGSCMDPFCSLPGDAWVDPTSGVKTCCTPTVSSISIFDDGCTGPGTPAGCTALKCREIKCPAGADVNTVNCGPNFSFSFGTNNLPAQAGCVGHTTYQYNIPSSDTNPNPPYCRCKPGHYTVFPGWETGTVAASGSSACVSCAENAVFNATSTGWGSHNSVGGGMGNFCRCKGGYKSLEANRGNPTGLQLPANVAIGCAQIQGCRNQPCYDVEVDKMASWRCVENCPGNSHPDSSCSAPVMSISGEWDCLNSNCRCNNGYGIHIDDYGNKSCQAHVFICPYDSCWSPDCPGPELYLGQSGPVISVSPYINPGCVKKGCQCKSGYAVSGDTCALSVTVSVPGTSVPGGSGGTWVVTGP